MGCVHRRLWGLCLPPVLFCVLDASMTLAGQSQEYWAGNYGHVNEMSPTFHQLLSLHPAAFAGGLLVWLAILVGILLLLPDTLALVVSIAVTFGHTVGAATWFLYRFEFGYQICNGLFLTSAITLGVCIRHGWGAASPEEYKLPGWRPWVRWIVAAGLFAFGIYLFVWPRSIPQ